MEDGLQCLVAGKEQSHVWYNLDIGSGKTAEEAFPAFIGVDLSDATQETGIDLLRALGGEAGSEKVKGVCGGG